MLCSKTLTATPFGRFSVGALRGQSDEEITGRFLRAYVENPDLAMKTLFYARDVRGGVGESRVFPHYPLSFAARMVVQGRHEINWQARKPVKIFLF